MPEYVLRNRSLPGQPIKVTVEDGAELSPEYEAAGWRVAKTDPDSIGPEPTADPIDQADAAAQAADAVEHVAEHAVNQENPS